MSVIEDWSTPHRTKFDYIYFSSKNGGYLLNQPMMLDYQKSDRQTYQEEVFKNVCFLLAPLVIAIATFIVNIALLIDLTRVTN
jgi:hypothetical protein